MELLFVDPHTIVRQGLCSLLAARGVEVVGQAADGRVAVTLAGELHPDVVVTEVVLPRLDGVEVAAQIRAAVPETRVLALSGYADRQSIIRMIDVGASGYVLKRDPFSHLLEALETVLAEEPYYSPELIPIVTGDPEAAIGDQDIHSEALAERERDVLLLLAEGASIKQAAAELGVSTKTVETYRSRVMKKLGLSGIAALTRYAVREGLITL